MYTKYEILQKKLEMVTDEIEWNRYNPYMTMHESIASQLHMKKLLEIKGFIEYEILLKERITKVQLYQNLTEFIPFDIIFHISEFGDSNDRFATYFIMKRIS